MVRSALKARLSAIAVGAALGGCSVYDHVYEYEPLPVEVASRVPGGEPLRTLVSVIGVRRRDAESELPASVEVRFRVENPPASTPAVFEPEGLRLFSADLQQFPDPLVRPEGPLDVEPGASLVVNAYFPFPDGRYPAGLDLEGLSVRWRIRVGGETVTSSAGFLRRPWAYYDRYPHRIGVGYGRWDGG